jgi:hypothetical protein
MNGLYIKVFRNETRAALYDDNGNRVWVKEHL